MRQYLFGMGPESGSLVVWSPKYRPWDIRRPAPSTLRSAKRRALAQIVEFDLRGGRGELLVTTPDDVYQDDTVGPSEPYNVYRALRSTAAQLNTECRRTCLARPTHE